MSTVKFDCITGSATFKFGISFGALFKVLQARKIVSPFPPSSLVAFNIITCLKRVADSLDYMLALATDLRHPSFSRA